MISVLHVAPEQSGTLVPATSSDRGSARRGDHWAPRFEVDEDMTCLAKDTYHMWRQLSRSVVTVDQYKCKDEGGTEWTNPLNIGQRRQFGGHVVEVVPDVETEGRQADVPPAQHENRRWCRETMMGEERKRRPTVLYCTIPPTDRLRARYLSRLPAFLTVRPSTSATAAASGITYSDPQRQ